jgi:hypothetical protein
MYAPSLAILVQEVQEEIVMLRKNAPMRAQLNPQLVKSLKPIRQLVDVPRIAVNQLQNHSEMHYAVGQENHRVLKDVRPQLRPIRPPFAAATTTKMTPFCHRHVLKWTASAVLLN